METGITQEQFEVLMSKSTIANEFINLRAFMTFAEQHLVRSAKHL